MFLFYLYSFIPVLFFSLFLWTDVNKKDQFGRRPVYLLISLGLFALAGLFQILVSPGLDGKVVDLKYFHITPAIVTLFIYLISYFFLEYSVHSQRILKSFLMNDFRGKLKSLVILFSILGVFCLASWVLYLSREEMLTVYHMGVFRLQAPYNVAQGFVLFFFAVFYVITNLNINSNIFNLQRGVIRKEEILFKTLNFSIALTLVFFYFFNGTGADENFVFLGLEVDRFPFEFFLVLNVVYAVRLYIEYFFRRIYNCEKTIEKQQESVELKNYLINLVLSSPVEEDINIIKSTVKDSLDRSMRNLVVTEYRITGAYVMRRNENILRVDSLDLINGYCVPLQLKGQNSMKKKSQAQLNDLILKKAFNLKKIENTPLERLSDWGEKLIKQVMEKGEALIVNEIPQEFRGLQRLIALFPVISSERLGGIIVVFKESFEELFPEERNVIKDLIDDLQIIFSITEGKRIQSEKNRLQGEMDAARTLQTSMVPRVLDMKGYDSACYMETATEVGGDAYDLLPAGTGYYFGIGDVSGHGLPAGLMALIQQAAFQSAIFTSTQSGRKLEPYELYNIVNKVVFEINTRRIGSDKFMTQNYFYEKDGRFSHAGAHEVGLLYKEQEEQVVELEGLTRKTAFMGFSPLIDAKNSSGTFAMEVGDVLVLYSDGIIEAKDHYSNQYGLENLKHLLLTNCKLPAQALLEKIVDEVKNHAASGDLKKYGGHLADDITLMVIKKLKT